MIKRGKEEGELPTDGKLADRKKKEKRHNTWNK